MKFSIIIPCYNLENYISKTLDSVLNQTYTNFEVLVIDDGSKDNSLSIIKDYEKNDRRVKVITKNNAGVSSARNVGLMHSSGNYILFLDGDDLISNKLLEKANLILNNEKIDMFSYGYKKFDESFKQVLKTYSYENNDKKFFTGEQFLELFFRKKISQHISSFIINSNIIKKNNIRFDENTKYAEDQEFQLICLSNCKMIFYEKEEYFYYIQRTGSAMSGKVVRDNFDVYFRWSKFLSDDMIPHYNNYLCYVFISNIRAILNKGSEKETVKKLLDIDHVLKKFSLDNTKIGIFTAFFILIYKASLKQCLIRRYSLNEKEIKN